MGRLIEYTLISADGVFEDPVDAVGVGEYQDDAYLRDALGVFMASDAMLFGRRTYEAFAALYMPGRDRPYADRINAMRKYVLSSTLEKVEWNNSVLVRGDAVTEVARLKEQDGGTLLIPGHGLLTETLLRAGLIDAIDLAIHPVLLGRGKQLFREGQEVRLRLVAAKTFSKIVKLTYEPQP